MHGSQTTHAACPPAKAAALGLGAPEASSEAGRSGGQAGGRQGAKARQAGCTRVKGQAGLYHSPLTGEPPPDIRGPSSQPRSPAVAQPLQPGGEQLALQPHELGCPLPLGAACRRQHGGLRLQLLEHLRRQGGGQGGKQVAELPAHCMLRDQCNHLHLPHPPHSAAPTAPAADLLASNRGCSAKKHTRWAAGAAR